VVETEVAPLAILAVEIRAETLKRQKQRAREALGEP
jgi:hypothetical protein